MGDTNRGRKSRVLERVRTGVCKWLRIWGVTLAVLGLPGGGDMCAEAADSGVTIVDPAKDVESGDGRFVQQNTTHNITLLEMSGAKERPFCQSDTDVKNKPGNYAILDKILTTIIVPQSDGAWTGNERIRFAYEGIGTYRTDSGTTRSVDAIVTFVPNATPANTTGYWLKPNFGALDIRSRSNFYEGFTYYGCAGATVVYEFVYGDTVPTVNGKRDYANVEYLNLDKMNFTWGSLNGAEGIASLNDGTTYSVKADAQAAVSDFSKADANISDAREIWNRYYRNTSYTWAVGWNRNRQDFVDQIKGEGYERSMVTMEIPTPDDHQYRFATLSYDFWFSPNLGTLSAYAPAPHKKLADFQEDGSLKREGYVGTKPVSVGETVTYWIEQEVQTRGEAGNGYLKYESLYLEDVLEPTLSYVEGSAGLAKWTPAGDNSWKLTPVANAGTIRYSEEERKLCFTFARDFLQNGMAYEGETYVLVFDCVVNAQAAVLEEGAWIPNTAQSCVNTRTFQTETVYIEPHVADLTIRKTVDKRQHQVNDVFPYTVKVTNPVAGSTAFQTVIRDETLPDYLRIVSSGIWKPEFTCNGKSYSCNVANNQITTAPINIRGGESAVLKFYVTAKETTDDVVNTAAVCADNVEEKTASAVVCVGSPSLEVQKTVTSNPSNLKTGSGVDYRIEVTNRAANTKVSQIKVEDVWDEGLEWEQTLKVQVTDPVSGLVSLLAADRYTVTAEEQMFSIEFAEEMTLGSSGTVSAIAIVYSGSITASNEAAIENTATAFCRETEPAQDSKTIWANKGVQPRLQIKKAVTNTGEYGTRFIDGFTVFQQGEQAAYSVNVTNRNQNSAAEKLVIEDIWEQGETFDVTNGLLTFTFTFCDGTKRQVTVDTAAYKNGIVVPGYGMLYFTGTDLKKATGMTFHLGLDGVNMPDTYGYFGELYDYRKSDGDGMHLTGVQIDYSCEVEEISGIVSNHAAASAENATQVTARAYIYANPEAALTVEKTVNQAETEVGSELVYTVYVKNTGSDRLLNTVIMDDTLPYGFELKSVQAYIADGTAVDFANVKPYNDSDLVIVTKKGDAASGKGDSWTARYVSNLDPFRGTEDLHTVYRGLMKFVAVYTTTKDAPREVEISNTVTAKASGYVTEKELSSEDSAATKLLGAKLNVTKSADRMLYEYGETAHYTITLTNESPITAREVALEDKTDTKNIRIDEHSIRVTDGSGKEWDDEQYNISCSEKQFTTLFGPELAQGEQIVIQYNAVLEGDREMLYQSPVTNTAVVVAYNADQVQAACEVRVAPCELSIKKTVRKAEAAVGDFVDYLVEVSNSSEITARAVQIQDVLPENLKLIDGSAALLSEGTAQTLKEEFQSSGNQWTVSGLTLAPGQSILVSFQAEAKKAGEQIVNMAAAQAENAEPVQARAVIRVLPGPVVTLAKRIRAEDFYAPHGEAVFVFTLTGTDKNGREVCLHQVVNLTEEYVDTHTDAEGMVGAEVTFENLREGTYTAVEEPTMRYETESITDVEHGTVAGGSVEFVLKSGEAGTAVFTNRKTDWAGYSDETAVVNTFQQ